MRKVVLAMALVAAVAFSASGASADPPDGLKGQWTMTIRTAVGDIPFTAAFGPQGQGSMTFEQEFPTVYRESATGFSISAEIPASSLFGSPTTLVVRGTRSGDTLSARVYAVTDNADDPTLVFVGPVSGERR